MARHYGVSWVPEFVRDYAAGKGSSLDASDVDAIARGQVAREDEHRSRAAARGERLLIGDTDLLSTAIYAAHYYGRAPDWVMEAARRRRPDLYLLLDIDLPWIPDPQRDRGDLRPEMHALFRTAVEASGTPFVVISGDSPARGSLPPAPPSMNFCGRKLITNYAMNAIVPSEARALAHPDARGFVRTARVEIALGTRGAPQRNRSIGAAGELLCRHGAISVHSRNLVHQVYGLRASGTLDQATRLAYSRLVAPTHSTVHATNLPSEIALEFSTRERARRCSNWPRIPTRDPRRAATSGNQGRDSPESRSTSSRIIPIQRRARVAESAEHAVAHGLRAVEDLEDASEDENSRRWR